VLVAAAAGGGSSRWLLWLCCGTSLVSPSLVIGDMMHMICVKCVDGLLWC
jgi:hypothetical protein